MFRLLSRLSCPRRALFWGNVAPGRNLPLTKSWPVPVWSIAYVTVEFDASALSAALKRIP